MSIDWDDAVIAPVMDVFGEAVTYRPKDGAPFEITGILTEAYLEVDAVGDAVPMSGQQSRLNVRLSAFMEIEPQPGDTLTVRRTGQTYWVREARPFSRTGGCDPESGPHHRGPERLFAPRLADLARRISADSGAHAARAQGIHHARHPAVQHHALAGGQRARRDAQRRSRVCGFGDAGRADRGGPPH